MFCSCDRLKLVPYIKKLVGLLIPIRNGVSRTHSFQGNDGVLVEVRESSASYNHGIGACLVDVAKGEELETA